MSALTDYLFAGNRPSTWTVDETIQAVEAMLDWPHRTISDDIMKGVLRTLRCLREDQGGYVGAARVMTGWHFTVRSGVLRDGRAFTLGETLRHEGPVVPCDRGYHASPTVLDALSYAPGPYLYRVELGGTIVPHGDPVNKYAASERTAISGGADASPLLRTFARSCALDVVHLWDAPPVVMQYLLTGDEALRSAAGAAAGAAAWAAAGAAWAAAWAAAGAAGAAAWAAAGAAGAAAWVAAWLAAGSAAMAVARSAAGAAAWAAAGAAGAAAWVAAGAARLETWAEVWLVDGSVPDLTEYPIQARALRGDA